MLSSIQKRRSLSKAKIKIFPFTDFCRFIFITYYIIVKQKEKKARNRRTNEQIDKEVISELEKLVAEYGFGNVNLSALMKAANIEANVFYRRYGSMENLYDRLAKQYDFWINDTIDVSSLNILGPKKFFAETFKTLYRNLSDNTVMQKLLLYEMSVINETTKRTAETRDIMNLNLIAFYDNLFKPAKINIKAIMANLIGGIYYLILHRRCAKTCTIDFSTQEGEKVFFEWIDFLTDAIFDKLEAYERNRKAAQEMLSDGISEFKICKYMGINKNDLKMLLSNSHRNSRELSKES
jgi:AcrR family transcriptional regulator